MKRGSYGIENCEECKRALRCCAATCGGDTGASGRLCASSHGAGTYAPHEGTTEYAILVGVLVVIAIVAITIFRPKIEELWNAIANGINGL